MRKAFSLMEIIVALAILAIISALSFPAVNRFYLDAQLSKHVKQVSAFIDLQRLVSKEINQVCKLNVDTNEEFLQAQCNGKYSKLIVDKEIEINIKNDNLFVYPDGSVLGPKGDSISQIFISNKYRTIKLENGGIYGAFKER